jgi:hypothetical protein
MLEEEAEGEVESEGFSDAGEELSGEQGVTAEVEEVIGDADVIESEERRPDGGEEFFSGSAGSEVALRGCGSGERGGQIAAINFAISSQWQFIQNDKE